MNTFRLSLLFLGLFLTQIEGMGQHAYIEQGLLDQMSDAQSGELLPIVLLLSDTEDLAALKAHMNERKMPVEQRPREVISRLMAKAEATQAPVLSMIESSGMAHSDVRSFWIANSIALNASTELIDYLSGQSEIAYISDDFAIVGEIDAIKGSSNNAKSEGGIEPGLAVIGAPEMWAMGYTGHGRMAMTFDTGVWPEHPALTDRFLPNRMPLSRTWFPFDSEIPTDKSSSHGTHVSGTMLGLNKETADTIGVAFGTYFIATDPTVSGGQTPKPLTQVMTGFQWAMNPDGDIETSDDVPDVINNSWGRTPSTSNPACALFVIATHEAVEAAGIASIFSAGNNGPEPFTIGVPNNVNVGLVNSFAVGALNGNVQGPDYPIANFSSRGPSLCEAEGSLLIKPEVSAPGVNVRSSVSNDNNYNSFSGTSMAAPHVSGAALLLKEAFPFLTGGEILLGLYFSAIDLGEPGEDNTYGMGLINVKAAYDYLSESHEPVPPASLVNDVNLAEIVEPSAPFRCSGEGISTVSPTVKVINQGINEILGLEFHYSINGGEEQSHTVSTEMAPGDTLLISLPAIPSPDAGLNELHVHISPLDDEYDLFNNHNVKRWDQVPPFENASDDTALEDDFSGGIDPEVWTIVNPDESITWEPIEALQSNGNEGTVAGILFSGYNNGIGELDFLIGPSMEVEGGAKELSFEYFYRRRSNNPAMWDSLSVGFLSECGDAYIELLRFGGESMFTNNVNQPNSVPESTEDWAVMNLGFNFDNVEELEDGDLVNLSFIGINHRGNNLMINNIQMGMVSSTSTIEPNLQFDIFPNPSSGLLRVQHNAGNSAQLRLYDLSGKLLTSRMLNADSEEMDLSDLSQGLYLLELLSQNGERLTRKLILQ